MKRLLAQQAKLTKQAADVQAALGRVAADVDTLTELKAKAEDLRSARLDAIASACLVDIAPDTQAIDEQRSAIDAQISALEDAQDTHALLTEKLANVERQQQVNQAKINQIVCDRMAAQFADAAQEFKEATAKLNDSLIKMKSALALTRRFNGNHHQMLADYQKHAFDLCVHNLPTHASRDVAAEAQASEMLEALRAEGIECGATSILFKSEVKDEDVLY